jgi:hypothetical protein
MDSILGYQITKLGMFCLTINKVKTFLLIANLF